MQQILLSELFGVSEDKLGAMAHLGIHNAYASDDGFCVTLDVQEQHLNVFGTVHGGIQFALCDQAVSACVTYHKRSATGLDGSIHHYRPAHLGDTLTATVRERKTGRTTGVYFVELKNQNGKLIADGMFTAMYLD